MLTIFQKKVTTILPYFSSPNMVSTSVSFFLGHEIAKWMRVVHDFCRKVPQCRLPSAVLCPTRGRTGNSTRLHRATQNVLGYWRLLSLILQRTSMYVVCENEVQGDATTRFSVTNCDGHRSLMVKCSPPFVSWRHWPCVALGLQHIVSESNDWEKIRQDTPP